LLALVCQLFRRESCCSFFKLPPKVFSTWDELTYWFKSTYGQPKNPKDQLQEYNNIVYINNETINPFDIHFTKLYNQILELIRAHNQDTFIQYYNVFPSSYCQCLEDKNVTNLGFVLQNCLYYEEQLERMDLPKEDFVKQTDISTILQLVQDMSNRMISYERKVVTSTSSPVEFSTQVVLRNQPTNSLFHNQPNSILSRAWCNLRDNNHKESTCEVNKRE
jgi:hypothetical protein